MHTLFSATFDESALTRGAQRILVPIGAHALPGQTRAPEFDSTAILRVPAQTCQIQLRVEVNKLLKICLRSPLWESPTVGRPDLLLAV